MFYIDEPDLTRLRFGDVIQGFIGTVPVIENPLNPDVLQGYKYQIKFFIPEFSVIMTHCCSIGKGNLALAPLQKIHHKILLNRLNSEIYSDFTELNRKIETKKRIPKLEWDNLTDKKKTKYELQGGTWNYIDKMFYEKHDLFTPYDIQLKGGILNTNFYVVDFNDIYNIECSKVKKKKIDQEILRSKFLELTDNTREEFKEKIALYFSRPADEA